MMPLWIGLLLFAAVSLFVFVALRSFSQVRDRGSSLTNAPREIAPGGWETVGQLLRDRRLSRTRLIDRELRKWPFSKKVQLAITQAGLSVMTDTWLVICLGAALLGMVIATFLGLSVLLSLVIGAGGFVLPMLFLTYRKRQRRAQIELQLPDVLDSISRAMQAGNSFSGALASVGRDTIDPLGSELRLVSEEIKFGSSTRDALMAMADRLESMDIRYFVIAVLIHAQTGGNLTELLRSLSGLIRDRQRLRKLGLALSAEGRLSAWILIFMPFVTAALLHFVNPEFMSLLWSNPTGFMAIQVMLALMLIGAIWMWRIVHFKV
jgi:tight adherence protein B